ncbi:tropomyosin-1 isoform X1 [Hydra vulgaris]|uniref:tropomyosin-1 isoform X1 n=1 Tax=Hydra vulgaris TaxID=6087 RepID=UPI0006413C5C|nr:tropomyosin-1 [Hydra vulgaris]
MEAIRKKMATLRKNLEDSEKAAQEAEDELNSVNQRANEVEEKLEELIKLKTTIEDKLDEADEREKLLKLSLAEAEKNQDEGLRVKRELEHRGNAGSSQLQRLERELSELLAKNEKVTAKLEKVTKEIADLETKQDIEEERCADLDHRVRELEPEMIQIGNMLRSSKINESKATVRMESSDEKLEKMHVKLEEIEERVRRTAAREEDLELKMTELEGVLQAAKDEYTRAKAELDATIQELSEL